MVKSEWVAIIALCIVAFLLVLAACSAPAPGPACAFQPGDMVRTKLHSTLGMVTAAYGRPCVYNVRFNDVGGEFQMQAWELE